MLNSFAAGHILRVSVGSGRPLRVVGPGSLCLGKLGQLFAIHCGTKPWFPESMIPAIGGIATGAEIVFAVCLILGFKTELFARLSGILLLVFALSMTLSTGIKGAFDYSVFSASAGAFALSLMKEKYGELDSLVRAPETE